MRNPRRIPPSDSLTVPKPLPKTRPSEDSLFFRMWNRWRDVAEQALATDFVQGIGAGTLDPVTYGAFNVGDAYYCFAGADDYAAAAARAEDPPLAAYLRHKHESYESYNATFPSTWRLKDASGIVPTDVCRRYAQFETSVAREQAPIYVLVAMLPCEYLWAWLAAQLAPPDSGNLYAAWITGNDDPHGAYQMGNYLEDFAARHPGALDPEEATRIYGEAMKFERDNFASATAAATASS